MKKSLSYIFLLLCFLFVQEATATNPISIEAYESTDIIKQDAQKNSLLSRAKKWTKRFLDAALDKTKINRLGLLALIFGIVSLLGWAAVAAGGGWVLIVMAALAIAGDILAIMTLWNTRGEKKEYRRARRMSWIGLILSLLTGILPILLLILVLATL